MEMNDMIIVSVDDHISEPPDMFDRHLQADALATAPKMKSWPNGANYWEYQGQVNPCTGLNAVVGRPRDEYGMEPSRLEEIRRGVWDVRARIDDMNVSGVAASLNFASNVTMDGRLFIKAPDKALALVHLRAYNDWHIDEWCAAAPGRFIPCGLLPIWDVDATAAEIKRLAAKGCTAVTINDNPTVLGLPSIHNACWEPMWKAITDTDMTICLHIGAGNPTPHASMETPIEAWITTMPMSISVTAADWVHLTALQRYPTLKVALSEGGIGWIPYFLERADFTHEHHHAWTNSSFSGSSPSETFKNHFLCCFIDDVFGLKNLDALNEDMVAIEADYPHSDCVWPDVPEYVWRAVQHLTSEQIDKITHKNAMRFFNFDLFEQFKREEVTVGALRAKAAAAGVDTTPVSLGGHAPLAPNEERRVITSGDIAGMFNRAAAAPADA